MMSFYTTINKNWCPSPLRVFSWITSPAKPVAVSVCPWGMKNGHSAERCLLLTEISLCCFRVIWKSLDPVEGFLSGFRRCWLRTRPLCWDAGASVLGQQLLYYCYSLALPCLGQNIRNTRGWRSNSKLEGWGHARRTCLWGHGWEMVWHAVTWHQDLSKQIQSSYALPTWRYSKRMKPYMALLLLLHPDTKTGAASASNHSAPHAVAPDDFLISLVGKF